jgi:hypothetical protein
VTAVTPAVYLDAQTREELTPPCDVRFLYRSGAIEPCPNPARFVQAVAYSCGCGGRKVVLCCQRDLATVGEIAGCLTCGSHNVTVLAVSTEPLR